VRAYKTIYFDEEHINEGSSGTSVATEMDQEETRRRRGGTRTTKNVGVVVALEDMDRETEGIVISTCHL
jgi:RNA exonuclease NGL2